MGLIFSREPKVLTVTEYPNIVCKKSKLSLSQKKRKRSRRKALKKGDLCMICHEPCLQKSRLCKNPLHTKCRKEWENVLPSNRYQCPICRKNNC